VHPHTLKSGNRDAIIENARKFLAIVSETRAKLRSPPVPAGI
jgi:hypothetical protein